MSPWTGWFPPSLLAPFGGQRSEGSTSSAVANAPERRTLTLSLWIKPVSRITGVHITGVHLQLLRNPLVPPFEEGRPHRGDVRGQGAMFNFFITVAPSLVMVVPLPSSINLSMPRGPKVDFTMLTTSHKEGRRWWKPPEDPMATCFFPPWAIPKKSLHPGQKGSRAQSLGASSEAGSLGHQRCPRQSEPGSLRPSDVGSAPSALSEATRSLAGIDVADDLTLPL